MLEIVLNEIVFQILVQNIDIESLFEKKLDFKNMSSKSANDVEIKIKEQIDKFILKFGLLESLLKLLDLMDVLKLKKDDAWWQVLLTSCENLYYRLRDLYLLEIHYCFMLWLDAFKNSKLDFNIILNGCNVKSFDKLLVTPVKVSYEQISLLDNISDIYEPLVNCYITKCNVRKYILSTIKRLYTDEEIKSCANYVIDVFNNTNSTLALIVVPLIIDTVNDVLHYKKKEVTKNTRQLIIPGFK